MRDRNDHCDRERANDNDVGEESTMGGPLPFRTAGALSAPHRPTHLEDLGLIGGVPVHSLLLLVRRRRPLGLTNTVDRPTPRGYTPFCGYPRPPLGRTLHGL